MAGWYRTPVVWLMLLSCAVLAWAAASAWPKQRPPSAQSEESRITKLPGQVEVFSGDPTLGGSGASITIIEFSDFECPYCAQSSPVVKQAVEQSAGKVRLVWKDYPGPGHEHALSAAVAAQCAHQQGKFWQYHDALFREQSRLSQDMYLQLAGEVGLRLEQFSSCLGRNETQPIVERNLREGDAIGLDGTPYFIINNQVWSGLLTSSDLEKIIRQYP